VTDRTLYIGHNWTTGITGVLTDNAQGLVYVNTGKASRHSSAIETLEISLSSVEGMARLLDWLRQNTAPARIFYEISSFESWCDQSSQTQSAADYLQGQIIGVTRLLEAALSLNSSLSWSFVTPMVSDPWSRACESYFRSLVEELKASVPSAQLEFIPAKA
jgi:hypothetical protein